MEQPPEEKLIWTATQDELTKNISGLDAQVLQTTSEINGSSN